MKRYIFFSLCIFISLFIYAQDKPTYMEGAVPEVNGKVLFSKAIRVKNIVSNAQLFTLMDKWAEDNYGNSHDNGLNSKILISDPEKKSIACGGEKYLVFKSGALVLDRAKMSYQLILQVNNGICDVTVRNIKYSYSDSKSLLLAEELITDKIALTKKKDKLNKYYDKFRTHTVDSVNSIFNSIDVYLNGTSKLGVVAANATPVVLPAESDIPIAAIDLPALSASSELPGFKKISPDKIPGNYIKLLSDWTLITSGAEGSCNVMTASWGGLGVFWEKPVAMFFLNPTRHTVQVLEKTNTYTISFYTEAYKDALKYCGSVSGRNVDKIKGSGLTPIKTPSRAMAFSEAWMILECKKMVVQQISADAVIDKSASQEWSKNGYHKMFIGEILNVWIK